MQSSITFSQLLTLLFIGLKLGGVIDWSWWLVLLPLYAPLLLFLAVVSTAFFIAAALTIFATLVVKIKP
jgi:hypothetical protein